jgi:hypothetical protein
MFREQSEFFLEFSRQGRGKRHFSERGIKIHQVAKRPVAAEHRMGHPRD